MKLADEGQYLISEWKGWTKVLFMILDSCCLEIQGTEDKRDTELSGEQQ